MGFLSRASFAKGWCPDCDAVKAPPDALLRMDNCILDELGVASLRRGSDVVYTLSGETDVHSLFTATLSGTRYRFAGAGSTIYLNGASLSTSVAGAEDIAFGSGLGQILMARSTTKKKYDGTTLRNWGISMTGGTPTVGTLAASTIAFASGNSTESPAFSYVEDDGTGAAFTTGFDGTANGAVRLHISTTTGQGRIRKTYASDQDWSVYSGGATVSDDDTVNVWCWIEDAAKLNAAPFGVIEAIVWVNNGLIGSNDYYDYVWSAAGGTTFVTGWNKLTARRGDFTYSSSTTKTWTTARAVDLFCRIFTTGVVLEVRFDAFQVSNGQLNTGEVTWEYRYAYNSGSYVALSAPSAASSSLALGVSGATITAPADASRDSQVNEIWLYRNDPLLGEDYFRVTVKTGVSGTGSVAIDDTLSDADALTADIVLDDTDTTPPSTIIGIAGPHYDRIWALTATALYPSRRLNVDTFSSAQVITISGADETCYWVVRAPGGLYVGTSKDIYRIDGTAAELPDGTIQVQKVPLNVDHPPISSAIATEGTQVVYCAADGWRAIEGFSSQSLSGATSLLYKGYARHGVSAVNITGGRFRAALAKDQLLAITPEGTDTTSSATLYRRRFQTGHWYRQTYPTALRAVTREPDGTVLVGDTSGQVWSLDSNSTADDNGTAIAVVVRTKVDDLGDPFRKKVANDLHLQVHTGGDALTAGVYLDQADAAAASASVTTDTLEHDTRNLLALPSATAVQLRLSGSLNAFSLGAVGWSFKVVPLGVLAWDSGPIDAGLADLIWARGVVIQCVGSADLAVTVWADGQLVTTATVTPASATQASPVTAWFGRGVKGGSLRITIESTALFMPYWIDVLRRVTGNSYELGAIRVKGEAAA